MPNVSVSNTPGLYIGSGASGVLNSAQQLYALLSNSGNVNFALINNNTAVQSFFIGNTSVFSNTNVAAYLPTYTGTLDNSSTIIALYANAATQSVQISNITATANANTAAYLLTATGNIGTVASRPNYAYANFFVGDGSQLVNLPFVPTSYSNANVAAYLPTYTGTLDNSSTIILLQQDLAGANAAIALVQGNLTDFGTYANATFGTSSYGNANVATYLPTYTGTLNQSSTIIDLYSNAAAQATAIDTITANLGAFETFANATFTSYSNTNVAAYLPVYGGTVNALSITGVVGQDIVIEPDGVNNINLNADTVRVGDNNQDFTLASHGTGNVTLTTHLGDANQGNITLVDGANGNIKLWPNGSGIVEAAGNVKANYFLGDGSQLINLPIQPDAYSNTNVAAYLPTYTGTLDNSSTIIALVANAAAQATSINSIDANIGAYQTFANANAAAQATSINSIDANIGSFQSYANTKIGTNSNSNLVVVSATTSTSTTTGAVVVAGGAGIAGNVNADRFGSTLGYFWANGTAYSTGSGVTYGNTEVAAFLTTAATTTTANLGNVITNSGFFWSNGVSYFNTPQYFAYWLLVGGGGGGGYGGGGGGGAGGLRYQANIGMIQGLRYTITVGAGGATVVTASTPANNGADSEVLSPFGTTTVLGGGGGGRGASGVSGQGTNGSSGGSGGGGGGYDSAFARTGGSGTAGQGFAGGTASSAASYYGGGGGGGGASAGGNGSGSAGGTGGTGNSVAITGAAVTYAAGGAGSGTSGGAGANGTANTGNGAQAGSNGQNGGTGGSGIVVFSIPSSRYSGNSNVTGSYNYSESSGNVIIQWTSSGTYNA